VELNLVANVTVHFGLIDFYLKKVKVLVWFKSSKDINILELELDSLSFERLI
jgi:hypothetical protein